MTGPPSSRVAADLTRNEDKKENEEWFERIPDSLLLVILNLISDVKSLGRCSLVSRRFHSLVPQVHSVLVRVDCVISDDSESSFSSSSISSSSSSSSLKPRSPFSSLFRLLLSNLLKPLHTLFRRDFSTLSLPLPAPDSPPVTHHSPTQVLKSFTEIKSLRIDLPSGELAIDDGVLLTWKAHFGSTLDNCVILGASSQSTHTNTNTNTTTNTNEVVDDDNVTNAAAGSIPESFYTNGGLKLRVVWTISSLIAASARHYLLQPIIADHKTLQSLVLTDADGQGVLCMDRDQLEELRVKPLSASTASKRTLVPALNMRLWYAPHLELGDGVVLKGATLVAIRPSENGGGGGTTTNKEISDLSWVSNAFEGQYGQAAKMLVKRRTYCLEMNSF